jgi:sugar/nucleoside kinase (ribokinase family)
MINNIDIAVIGHFSVDYILLPWRREPYKIMGGAVAFVSLVVRRLGGSVAVVSRIGRDFPEIWLTKLQQEGINVSSVRRVDEECTTSFELQYGVDLEDRRLSLKSQGSQINIGDLPKNLCAKAVHIAPIANEISLEVVKRLSASGSVLSIDPQGMTRQFNENGHVFDSSSVDKHVFSLIDIFKSSLGEILLLTGESAIEQAIKLIHNLGPKIVLVTQGAKGAILSVNGQLFQIPVCKPNRLVDPTGAGDVFIGAFLTEYIGEKEPYWCACVGSAAASLVVEDVGTSFLGDKEEIMRRAKEIYKKK